METNQLYEPTTDYFLETTDYVSSGDDSQIPQICDVMTIQEFNRTFQPCMELLVSLIGITGNILVLLIYTFTKKVKTMTDIYLINLAVADLLMLFMLPIMSFSSIKGWILGNEMCKFMHTVYYINFFSGFLFLTCISVDRYNVIVRAIKAHTMRHRCIYCSKIISLVVWVASILLSLPEIIYSQPQSLDGSHLCKMIVSEEDTIFKSVSSIIQIICGFFLPFCVMVPCYFIIIRTLLIHKSFQKHKAVKVVLSLVLVFVIFQLPYTLVTSIDTHDFMWSKQMTCEERKHKDAALIITSNFAFIRFCLNPILYTFIGVQFRNDVLLLLKHVGCIYRKHSIGYYGSSRNVSSPGVMETSSSTLHI